ncbi:MAG: DUF5683 domain-containing protein [Candidatus Kapaibacterium sp.]
MRRFLSTSHRAAILVIVLAMCGADRLRAAEEAATKSDGVPRTVSAAKSPSGAILRSIVFPGWGQLYNESYVKAGVFGAAAVSITGIIVWNDVKFSNAQGRYDVLADTDPLKDRTFREKEFYRDQRDVAGLWLLGVYALAAVDAYVGAHLFDFDVSDKGVSWMPLPASPSGPAASLQVAIRF